MSDVERGCECPDCLPASQCAGMNAPVAYLVERNGKKIKVCTRCILGTDKQVKTLVNETTPIQPYIEYDLIGSMSLGMGLGGETQTEDMEDS